LLEADLSNENLLGTILVETTEVRAVLFQEEPKRKAKLYGKDLRSVRNMTQQQLDKACGNQHTLLPKDLEKKDCKD
jgi:uncharacterized protein YjbI with pentapeptide repeats